MNEYYIKVVTDVLNLELVHAIIDEFIQGELLICFKIGSSFHFHQRYQIRDVGKN